MNTIEIINISDLPPNGDFSNIQRIVDYYIKKGVIKDYHLKNPIEEYTTSNGKTWDDKYYNYYPGSIQSNGLAGCRCFLWYNVIIAVTSDGYFLIVDEINKTYGMLFDYGFGSITTSIRDAANVTDRRYLSSGGLFEDASGTTTDNITEFCWRSFCAEDVLVFSYPIQTEISNGNYTGYMVLFLLHHPTGISEVFGCCDMYLEGILYGTTLGISSRVPTIKYELYNYFVKVDGSVLRFTSCPSEMVMEPNFVDERNIAKMVRAGYAIPRMVVDRRDTKTDIIKYNDIYEVFGVYPMLDRWPLIPYSIGENVFINILSLDSYFLRVDYVWEGAGFSTIPNHETKWRRGIAYKVDGPVEEKIISSINDVEQINLVLDRQPLIEKIEECENDQHKLKDYLSDGWYVFYSELENARKTRDDKNLTEDMMNQQIRALDNARNGLKTVDKTALNDLYNRYLSYNLDPSMYKTAGWNTFYSAMENAKEILDTPVSKLESQEQVDGYYYNLLNAYDTLEKVDKTALQNKYDEYNSFYLVQSKYTEESWDAYNVAMENASVLLQTSVDDISQSDIDTCLDELIQAYNNLEMKPVKTVSGKKGLGTSSTILNGIYYDRYLSNCDMMVSGNDIPKDGDEMRIVLWLSDNPNNSTVSVNSEDTPLAVFSFIFSSTNPQYVGETSVNICDDVYASPIIKQNAETNNYNMYFSAKKYIQQNRWTFLRVGFGFNINGTLPSWTQLYYKAYYSTP